MVSRTYAAWQRRIVPLVARRALAVVTVSAFSRSQIAETLDVAPERIAVIAGGVDERFRPGAAPTRATPSGSSARTRSPCRRATGARTCPR